MCWVILCLKYRAILHDPERFPEPGEFRPERFLQDGQLDPDAFDPVTLGFGSGRRYVFLASSRLSLTHASADVWQDLPWETLRRGRVVHQHRIRAARV